MGGSTLEQVINGSTDNDTLAAGVDGKTTNLDTVTASNILNQGSFTGDLDELLAGIAFLVEVADIARGHLLLQGNADAVGDTLEPNRDVGNESNAGAQLRADLPLVDVVCQAVGNDVVGEELDVVLGARLGASTRVAGHTEGGGLAAQEGNKRSNTKLGSGGIAARVGDAGGTSDLRSVDQLRQTVGPLVVEAVVSAEVDDDVALLGALVDGIDERLADTVGESHDPAVNVTVLGHLADVFGAEVLVDDLALVVTLELLASQLTR